MNVYPPGIPDTEFIRGDVPMTKAEVRALTLSKARLRDGLRVLDIGAGTGSLSIEAALLCPRGEVTAVERARGALELLDRNIARFGVTNVAVVAGEAPDALAGLGIFDRILLGGSGGRIAELLHALPAALAPGGWVVANAICLESAYQLLARFRRAPWFGCDIVHVAVSRGAPIGSLTRFEPLSPVWIVAAQVEGE